MCEKEVTVVVIKAGIEQRGILRNRGKLRELHVSEKRLQRMGALLLDKVAKNRMLRQPGWMTIEGEEEEHKEQ